MTLGNNLLVGQSGGPTAVINCSLLGVIREAMAHSEIDGIYGMRHGIQGLLRADLVDLRREEPSILEALARTPSAALGSCRHQLSEDDLERVLAQLRAYRVRHFIYIGGNDSADTSHRISTAARQAGMNLTVVGVPKTIDNDLPEMDHTPGYPSIARYVAAATQDAAADAAATRFVDPVVILEVMGRNSGWVAAAAALARRRAGDAPHIICVPERPLAADSFLRDVAEAHRVHGYAVVVLSETVRDEHGVPWAQAPETDAFGHPRLVGAARRLSTLIRLELGLRARFNTPGTLQRSSALCASPVDRREALAAGQSAVIAALRGQDDQMVTILRLSDRPYRSYTGLAPLVAIANRERTMPDEYLSERGNDVTGAFARYLRPLLGGRVPAYARLRGLPPVREAPQAQAVTIKAA